MMIFTNFIVISLSTRNKCNKISAFLPMLEMIIPNAMQNAITPKIFVLSLYRKVQVFFMMWLGEAFKGDI